MSTIGNVLRKAGSNRLYILLEDGDSITDIVNEVVSEENRLDPTTATGWDVMDALAGIDKETRKKILDTETDCEIEIPTTTPELAQLLKSNAGSAGKWKIAIAVLMALLIALVVVVYCLIMYDNATYTHVSPGWQQVTLVILVPGGIVWTWFGVLTKENRDILTAVIGELPKAGIGGAVINAITRRNSPQETPPASNMQQPPYQPQQQYNTATTAPDGDTNDTPPSNTAR